jgi:hypothetical protein
MYPSIHRGVTRKKKRRTLEKGSLNHYTLRQRKKIVIVHLCPGKGAHNDFKYRPITKYYPQTHNRRETSGNFSSAK